MVCKRIAGGFACGPSKKAITKTGKIERKWCFTCRKYVRAIEKEIFEKGGWYDPQVFFACPNGRSHDFYFPGSEAW